MARIVNRDTILPTGGGPKGTSPIYVQAGTTFFVNWYTLHRLESIWGPDAHEFKPERWRSFKPEAWQFMPFGGGPRNCLGQTKALVEAAYVVVRFAQEFEKIEARDEREWRGRVQLTAKNANGCRVAFVERRR